MVSAVVLSKCELTGLSRKAYAAEMISSFKKSEANLHEETYSGQDRRHLSI